MNLLRSHQHQPSGSRQGTSPDATSTPAATTLRRRALRRPRLTAALALTCALTLAACQTGAAAGTSTGTGTSASSTVTTAADTSSEAWTMISTAVREASIGASVSEVLAANAGTSEALTAASQDEQAGSWDTSAAPP